MRCAETAIPAARRRVRPRRAARRAAARQRSVAGDVAERPRRVLRRRRAARMRRGSVRLSTPGPWCPR